MKKFEDLIGKSELITKNKAIEHWKAKNIDLSKILYKPEFESRDEVFNSSEQNHDLDEVLDVKLLHESSPVIEKKVSTVTINKLVKNTDRSLGAMLSGVIAKKFGHKGLREDSIVINLEGTAGQSLGTFLSSARLQSPCLVRETITWAKVFLVAKIIIRPFKDSTYKPEKNIIVGNTVLYGAISGECYFSGMAGERFAVRNSGAIAVVEGTGDHCCEYMTGGVIMVLGNTGVNFGAGMSGGIAYVYQKEKDFKNKCNMSMVNVLGVKKSKHILPKTF